MKINKVFLKLLIGIMLLLVLMEGAFLVISISDKKRQLMNLQKMELENYGVNKLITKDYIESELKIFKKYLTIGGMVAYFLFIIGVYVVYYRVIGKTLVKIIHHNKNSISFDPNFIANDLPNDEIGELILMREKMLKDLRGKIDENKALTRMLVHDISNALSVVITNSEILLRELSKNEFDSLEIRLKKILKSSLAQKNLIDRIRNLEALGSNKASITLKQFSLNKMLRDSIELFEDNLEAKRVSINFTTEVSESDYVFVDDVLLFNNVINNLMSNAIKFSAFGSTIYISSFKEKKNMLSFTVLDHGIGIPSELITKIFSPDLETNREGTQGEKGTGFGLPLAFSTVKILNGELLVSSKSIEENSIDHWTKFQVNLPQHES